MMRDENECFCTAVDALYEPKPGLSKAWTWVLVLCLCFCAARVSASGGAACVMAKWQGNTLDYALVTDADHVVEAQEKAEKLLKRKGYGSYRANVNVLHPQGLTNLPHAFVVVIKTTYTTMRGKQRTSFGCGFAKGSRENALWDAMRDLQSHSWGWKPDRDGYEVVEQLRY